jgi:hypothetical protein
VVSTSSAKGIGLDLTSSIKGIVLDFNFSAIPSILYLEF